MCSRVTYVLISMFKGRTGHHWWAFEMHGVVPDIITIAKAMGNGQPLGIPNPYPSACYDPTINLNRAITLTLTQPEPEPNPYLTRIPTLTSLP